MVANTEDISLVAKLVDRVSPALDRLRQRLNNNAIAMGAATRQFSESLKQNEIRFQGWALSVMFFGMAIQRVMNQIWKNSVKTFQDVMHSVEGSVTQFDMLGSSIKYLGFTIGQALEPVAAWLIPIVEKIANWVVENEGLARTLFVIGTIMGSLLFVVGFLTLAFTGIVTMTKNAVAAFSLLRTAAASLGGTLALLGSVAVIGGIILLIGLIIKMKNEMGGWLEFFKSVVRGILRLGAVLFSGLLGVFSEIGNAAQFMWNLLVEASEAGVNSVIKTVNALITAYNKIPFLNDISLIPSVSFDKAKADVKSFGQSFLDTYGSMMEKYFEWENRVLSPSTQDGGGAASSSTITNYNEINVYGSDVTAKEIVDEFNRRVSLV